MRKLTGKVNYVSTTTKRSEVRVLDPLATLTISGNSLSAIRSSVRTTPFQVSVPQWLVVDFSVKYAYAATGRASFTSFVMAQFIAGEDAYTYIQICMHIHAHTYRSCRNPCNKRHTENSRFSRQHNRNMLELVLILFNEKWRIFWIRKRKLPGGQIGWKFT